MDTAIGTERKRRPRAPLALPRLRQFPMTAGETVRERKSHFVALLASLLLILLCFPSLVLSQAQDTAQAQSAGVEEQIEELRSKAESDSLNPKTHYELANALHDAGEREEAVLCYDKALLIEPEFKEALINRGVALNELGRIDEAMSSFERALSIDPHDVKAFVNLGNSFYALQKYDEALKRYKSAIESDSTCTEAYYYIGIAFADAGIYKEAIREWEKILKIAPNSDAARNARENIQVLKTYLSTQ